MKKQRKYTESILKLKSKRDYFIKNIKKRLLPHLGDDLQIKLTLCLMTHKLLNCYLV